MSYLCVEASADSVVDRGYGARYDRLSDHYGEGFLIWPLALFFVLISHALLIDFVILEKNLLDYHADCGVDCCDLGDCNTNC